MPPKRFTSLLTDRYHSFTFNFPLLKGLPVPLQIETWNAFNDKGEVSQYDATFKWWQWTVDYLLGTAAQASNSTLAQITASATQLLAQSICTTAQTYCNGTANSQYQSMDACKNFLTTQIRFGEAYELGK